MNSDGTNVKNKTLDFPVSYTFQQILAWSHSEKLLILNLETFEEIEIGVDWLDDGKRLKFLFQERKKNV
jgi:hypothetical protein